MNLERLTTSTIASALALCLSLKEQDEHPCSFWGYETEDLEHMVGSDDKITFVSVVDETVRGIGTLSRGSQFQDHWAEISIAIHPAYRKAGIGKGLVLELEKTGKRLGLEFIKALILENNVHSRGFFSSLGYEHRATLFHDFKIERFGHLSDCVYYKILLVT